MDSEGGECSLGSSFSAFTLEGDCTPILAVKIDILITYAIYETEETSGQEWRRGTTRPPARDAKGRTKNNGSRKDIAYYLVQVKPLGRVQRKWRDNFWAVSSQRGQSIGIASKIQRNRATPWKCWGHMHILVVVA